MKHFTLPFVTRDSYKLEERTDNEKLYQCQDYKERLDALKNQIGTLKRHQWTRAVKFTNPYENVVRNASPKISRAYYKILEIVKDFDLEFNNIDTLKTLHLCEGPGGFIEAIIDLRHAQNKKLDWTGITLKNTNDSPNLPDFVDKIDMANVTYGEDNTGDLTNIDNINFLGKMFEEKGMAHLITADGGFDVSDDHCSQENQSYQLMLSQVISALECQQLGGAFIMKVFDCYSNKMTDLLYLLSIHYQQVYLTKPYSSRPCNSEKYIVCTCFKGITNNERVYLKETFKKYNDIKFSDVDSLFIDKIYEMNCGFTQHQMGALTATLAYATKTQWVEKPKDMSHWYIHKYDIK